MYEVDKHASWFLHSYHGQKISLQIFPFLGGLFILWEIQILFSQIKYREVSGKLKVCGKLRFCVWRKSHDFKWWISFCCCNIGFAYIPHHLSFSLLLEISRLGFRISTIYLYIPAWTSPSHDNQISGVSPRVSAHWSLSRTNRFSCSLYCLCYTRQTFHGHSYLKPAKNI